MEGSLGRREKLKVLSPAGYFIQPMLNPSGDAVVFWGQESGETGFNLWRRDLTAAEPVRLTGDRAVTGQPFWSADGKQLVCFSTLGLSEELAWRMSDQFTLGRSPRNLWIMRADGTHRRRLTTGSHVDERPCFSPDGSTVVFVSDRSGAMNLWAVSTTGDSLRPITQHGGLDYRPTFSPDGSKLAFFTDQHPQRGHDLAIMDWASGKTEFPMPAGAFRWVHGPFWLADGGSLLLHGLRENEATSSVWKFRLNDQHLERITIQKLAGYGHGSLNREGDRLYFDTFHL